MIRRIGFRRILPLSQLAIYLLLVAIGAYQIGQDVRMQRTRQVAFQEESDVPFEPAMRPELPRVWIVAVAVNLPAVLGGALLSAAIQKPTSEIYVLLFAIPLVPLLWMPIGRWFDYQLGWRSAPRKSIPRIVANVFGIAVAAFGLLSAIVSVSPSHGRSLTAQALIVSAWACLLLLMCITSLLRRQADRS